MTTLFLGLGNPLRRDDGVGHRAAERLAAEGLPARAAFQPLPELAAEIAAAARVVFLDADLASAPGAVRLRSLAPSDRLAAGHGLGLAAGHGLDVAGLLALAAALRGGRPPEAWALSVGVADLGAGEGLSPPVASALDELLRRARRYARDPGALRADGSGAA